MPKDGFPTYGRGTVELLRISRRASTSGNPGRRRCGLEVWNLSAANYRLW
jgi:hypothetical protein